MNEKQANAIYDVLVQECGAFEDERQRFVYHQTHDPEEQLREWRFCGKLGFGGKFWRNAGRLYVNCYNKDMTKKRQKMIDRADERLAKLLEDFVGEGGTG